MDNINRVVNYLSTMLVQDKDTSSPASTSSGIFSGMSEDDSEMGKSVEKLIGVSAETYLNIPEDVLSITSASGLETAIELCKTQVLNTAEDSEEMSWLVRRLIELRLRLLELKDVEDEAEDIRKNKVLLGHHFSLQSFPTSTAKYYCDRCSGIIWNVLHSWYLCVDCDFKCHVKCLSQVHRICAHVQVTESPEYITEICPEAENGLANQNYRCAECLTHTSFRDSVLEPRLCDYNGKYYCPTCHWNSTVVIPARVINNWDFNEKKVSRSSKQILTIMSKLPVLRLQDLNPILFATIEKLEEVKLLRQKLTVIKKYLTSCKAALDSHLLWHLDNRLHLIENEDTYSLQDLLDLQSGELLPYLNKLLHKFSKHIKNDCKVCFGRGYFCEPCKKKDVIFPFEENVVTCHQCHAAYHFSCWVQMNHNCPKCKRIKQRNTPVSQEDASHP